MMSTLSRTLRLAAGGWLALLGAAMAQSSSEEEFARDLTIQQRPVYQFVQQQQAAQRPEQSQVPVTAWTDRPDAIYRIGEPVTISVRPDRDAHITVLNIGTSGRTTVLFPNTIQRDSRVRAGQTISLGGPGAGYNIVPQGPAGVELVQVIATTRPLTLVELNQIGAQQGASPFVSLGRSGEEVARDLAVQLTGAQSMAVGPSGLANLLIRVQPLPPPAAAALPPPPPAPATQQWSSLLQQAGVPVVPAPTQQQSPPAPAPTVGLTQAITLPPGLSAPSLIIRTDKSIYGPQDTIHITVAALAECRLVLFSVGPTGQVAQLLPNPSQPEATMRPGQVITVPPRGSPIAIRPRGTPGMETIVGICAQAGREAGGIELLQGQRDLAGVTQAITQASSGSPAPTTEPVAVDSVVSAATVYFVRP
jgi:hypothetical protein